MTTKAKIIKLTNYGKQFRTIRRVIFYDRKVGSFIYYNGYRVKCTWENSYGVAEIQNRIWDN